MSTPATYTAPVGGIVVDVDLIKYLDAEGHESEHGDHALIRRGDVEFIVERDRVTVDALPVRINVYLTLTAEEYAAGWSSDPAELEASLKARLSEVYGDDGGAYGPLVLGIDVEEA